MQNYSDMISFVYSDNGTYFFQKLYQEVDQMRSKGVPIESGHFIEELNMTLSEALALAVSATFAIQDEFVKEDHHKEYDAWREKHPREDMDYQTWISKSLVYQLGELKLTDINAAFSGMDASEKEDKPAEKKKKRKRKGFLGKY
ncbi:MAG: hypothetical protein HFH61_01965 [Lachnospiraceae bacterium]|nr:hypothetical protein [Lachnospiraceae bacterium]